MHPVYLTALKRASELKGSVEALADHLELPPAELHLAMQGKLELPSAILSRVVDLVFESEMRTFGAPFVLVVEDDPAAAYALAGLIKRLGYRVDTAMDAKTALEHIRKLRPAYAFIALRLPDADGRAIAQVVRAEGLDTRLFAITAFDSSEEERRKSVAAGFESHWQKPVTQEMIESILPRGPLQSAG